MCNQRGLSLVELMISITLGLLLMAGVVQMFVSSNVVFGTQQGLSRVQETGRLAMEFIGRDLRMASFSGCRNTVIAQGTSRISDPLTGPPGNALGLTGLHRNFAEGLHGYTVKSDGTAPELPHGIATDLGTTFTVAKDSDILVIRGGSERGMQVNKVNIAGEVYGYTDQSLGKDNCVEGFCKDGIAIISNCRNGRVFKISDVPSVSVNEVTLTHTDAWTVVAPSNDIYDAGSIVPIHTFVYFVATSATPVGNTTPSLWQKVDNQPAIEILQGVERMALQYMVKPTAGTPFPSYQDAADVDFWDPVSSVQVDVVVRGDNPFELDAPQKYDFRTGTVTPTDRYMRKVFRSTFSLRSRNP